MGKKVTITLTKQEVDAYWSMSAYYSAQFEGDEWRAEALSSDIRAVERIDQKIREASA